MLEGKTILVEAEDAGLYWLRRNLITCMYLFLKLFSMLEMS